MGTSARRTWDLVAQSGSDALIGDPRRAAAELDSLFGRLGGQPPGDSRCLEVGCGSGRMTLELVRRFADVTAVDISAAMIERAKATLEAHGAPQPTFLLVSGETLEPVPDRWAEVLVCFLVLQHLPSRRNVLRYIEEIERVLTPGGEAFVQIPVLRPHPRARLWRRVRHGLVRLQDAVTANPRWTPAYRGFRVTDRELRQALDETGLEVAASDRADTSPYRFCDEVFLRLRIPAPS